MANLSRIVSIVQGITLAEATISGTTDLALTSKQYLAVYRGAALAGVADTRNTSWEFVDSGLATNATYSYRVRVEGSGGSPFSAPQSYTPTVLPPPLAINFLDAFEIAWEQTKLGPVAGGTADPATLGPIRLYRGQMDDPSVPDNTLPPFCVYHLMRDAKELRSTRSEVRTRMIEAVLYGATEGDVMNYNDTVRNAVVKKDATGAFFFEYMRPDTENVLDAEIFQFTHFIDDLKKTAAGLWVSKVQLIFTIRWDRG